MSEMLLYLEYISNAEVVETSRQQILSRVHEIDRLLEGVTSMGLPAISDWGGMYRGTLLTRKRHTLGPYGRPMPRALWWLEGGVIF